jgi:uncharacterized protein involved in exopolysaccharide biosynthesis
MTEELREVETRIRSFDQQIVFLDSQLVQLSPTADAVTATGARVLNPRDQLKSARVQLVAMSSRYAPDHPDVRRLQREIARLEADASATGSASDAREEPSQPDNPAYIQIRAQREMTASERSPLVERRGELQRLIGRTERAQLEMPDIDREYRAMLLEAQSEQEKYAEVRQKQMAAQLSQNLETEQKGERFTLIDPPVQPQEPISPNRPLIAGLGLLLALAGAIGTLVLLEAMDPRVHGRRQVVRIVGEPPLAVLPWTAESPPAAWRRIKLSWVLAGAVALCLTGLAAVHFFFKPLDVLWALLARRFGA